MTLVNADTGEVVAHSLAENEAVIEAGLATFVEVGRALMEIRDGRQYRSAGWSDFDTYCRERWGMARAHAYRMIEASEVVSELSPIGDTDVTQAQLEEARWQRDELLMAVRRAAIADWDPEWIARLVTTARDIDRTKTEGVG